MTENNKGWRQCDYTYEEKRTNTPLIIVYTAISIAIVLGKYATKVITFLPIKGLERLANKTSKIFDGHHED